MINSESFTADTSKTCELCSSSPAKYVCPRCGVPYCSLQCYKDEQKHLKCSESFYRDCVMEDLRVQQVKDPEGAKKMTETLQRFREQYDQQGEFADDDEEEELDSDDDEPLEKRMNGLNFDDADEVWKHLTDEEKSEFKKFVKNVNVQDVVPEWTPWWTIIPSPPKLVEEMTQDSYSKSISTNGNCRRLKVHNAQPDMLYPIPSMSSLTKIKPNDHVKKGLANVIAAYVWTARLYNGEFLTYENPCEVAAAFISLSSFLGNDSIFSTFEHSLADVSLNACRNPDLFDGGPALQSGLNKDVFIILSGPKAHIDTPPNVSQKTIDEKVYVLSALTECYNLLCRVAKESSSNKSKTSSSKADIKVPQKNRIKIEELSDNSIPVTSYSFEQSSLSSSHCDTETTSFKTVFSAETPMFFIEPKVLSKAKRKVYYLLAFANEYDVL